MTDSRREGCKGCSADVHVSRRQIDRMLAALADKEFDVVSDTKYADRLASCRRCPSLQYGSTCMHCGCIVEIRAKLGDKGCPHPAGSRWTGADAAAGAEIAIASKQTI
ncbi:DUF6171 family protein [Cohnella nanjingensis]|uniref:Uncharacterized protein n=1 Tax=Cohnella nanjingensis TaxID=1387779 RepID=A0A7X0RTW8_9BACL|nr:DUF6171 family protein [Cohnella nanjingensis]MBB6672391.1 hypothetical protein [Cohnella nanjingensis]